MIPEKFQIIRNSIRKKREFASTRELIISHVLENNGVSQLTDTVDDLPDLGVIETATGQHPVRYHGNEHREQPHAEVGQCGYEAILNDKFEINKFIIHI